MPAVSFYVLPTESEQERYFYACKLIEKSYRSACFCYVLTDSSEHSRLMDDLLWTFRPGSFIPHQLYTGELPPVETIFLIGSMDPPEPWQRNVINLSLQCPANFVQAARILEVIDNSEATATAGRMRYRRYQQAGIEPVTHKIQSL